MTKSNNKPITKWTEKEIWEELRSRRDVMQRAESSYFMLLQQIEEKRRDFWNTTKSDAVTFDSWLETHHPLTPQAAVYRSFLRGYEVCGDAEAVEDMGVEATAELGRFKKISKDRMTEFLKRCREFRRVHETAPSEKTANRWRLQLDESVPRVTSSASKLAELEAENRNLRAKVRELEATNKALKEKLKGSKVRARS